MRSEEGAYGSPTGRLQVASFCSLYLYTGLVYPRFVKEQSFNHFKDMQVLSV